jgi:hypothetical protein
MSIVSAANKMKRDEVEVISVISYNITSLVYFITYPETEQFESFEKAYNYLAMHGYREVSKDKNRHYKTLLMYVIKAGGAVKAVMVMSKNKLREETCSSVNNNYLELSENKMSNKWNHSM